MYKIRKIITVFVFSLLLVSLATPISAQGLKDAFDTGGGTNGGSSESPLGTVADQAGYDRSVMFTSVVGRVIMAALSLLGVIFLVLMVYAGYLWMTASGNESQATKARSIIISSVIGLLVVLSAYSISYFVLSSLQEGTINNPEQPTVTE